MMINNMPYVIRKILPSDLTNRFKAIKYSIDHLKPWFPWVHDCYTIKECEQMIAQYQQQWSDGKDYNFAIIEKESNQYIGEVRILDVKRDYAECNAALAYWVRHDCLRCGVAKFAVQQAALFAFNELKLIRLKIMTKLDNIASQKLIEACGAKYEGVLRNQWVFNEAVLDVKLYSLIPGDVVL